MAGKTKLKIRGVRAAARPLPSRKRTAATKPQYLTPTMFYNLTDDDATHPAMRRQKESFGWPIYLVRTKAGVVVAAGCRWKTLNSATAHWTERTRFLDQWTNRPHLRVQSRARKMLALLPKLKQRARRLGWL